MASSFLVVLSITWIGVALVVGGLTGLVRSLAPVHAPVARSAHAEPTPVSGGLAVALGVSFVALVLVWLKPEALRAMLSAEGAGHVAVALGAAVALSVLGAIDDALELAGSVKTGVFVLIAAGLVLALGPVRSLAGWGWQIEVWWLVGFAGSILWVFTVVNAVNFMDGANGVIAGVMGVAGLGLALAGLVLGAGHVAVLGVMCSGAFAGFLPWNAPRARMFMGDAGSLFAGGIVASAGLALAHGEPGIGVWLAPLFVMPLLADVLLTLLERARAGVSVWLAHRDHLYQWRIRAGASHTQVAVSLAARTAVWSGVAVGVCAADAGAGTALGVMLVSAIVETGLWRRVRGQLRGRL